MEKETVTIEVPVGYKIKSQKIVDNQVVVELEPNRNIVVVSSTDTVLAIKPEFLEKLKYLGVYELWLTNVKAHTFNSTSDYISRITNAQSFQSFIDWSFKRSLTPEGFGFWERISRS
jgi:hypothetical protein